MSFDVQLTFASSTAEPQTSVPAATTPTGVTILAILMILAGLFDIVQGAGLIRGDPFEAFLGPFNILLGLVFIATGIGFLKQIRWAWTPGVALALLNLVRSFSSAAQDGIIALPGILIALLIVYYLFTPRIRKFFEGNTV